MTFTARVVHGAGRGKHLGSPTLNLNLDDVPSALEDGVYACWVEGQRAAVMHIGPRPTFGDMRSCEVHVLDEAIEEAPERINVDVIVRLRDVKTFDSPEALRQQISEDIAAARRELIIGN